ncbi:MAG: glycosyltransferase family 4 protein, partial [Patescibacteria group bacterium]
REERPDVIIVHHVLPLGTVAWLYGLFAQTPFVVCLHGMDFATANERPWKRFLLRRVLTAAHTVVANSKALGKQVQQLTGRDALVCYPTPWIQPLRKANIKRAQNPVVLSSVTRLVERKGIDRVLKALASMPHLHERLRYHITGVGPFAPTIRECIDRLRLEHIVTLSETDDSEDLRRAFEEADIFVLPTTSKKGNTEGFGMVYLEAALFGAPSIASRQAGVDEAVIDKNTGLLVSNDDELAKAISRLVCDEAYRRSLGMQAKERARQFTPEEQFHGLRQRLYD